MELSIVKPALSVEQFIHSAWDSYDTAIDHRSLKHYIAYVNGELETLRLEEWIHVNPDQLANFLTFLKICPHVPRAELHRNLRNQDTSPFPESALDLTIRIMFAIATLPDSAIGGQLFRPRWKSEESIAALVDHVFPRRLPSDIAPDSQRIKMQKLSLGYVTQYIQVEIQWTDYLSDHLLLSTGVNWKRLYVFRHPAFIRAALRHLEGKGAVTEMQALSQRRSIATALTPPLLEPLPPDHSYHATQRDALLPRSVSALYQRFPYWGERLYDLWVEAEDPTPITTVGKWSDSKKSGRYVYWAGFVALVIVILFGIAATVLAALQVWISWCSWVDDPNRPGCSKS
ncbi:hypothetical protein PG993_012402 [Apiospora rasikravindrae]|uniref:Uncharacterized protein n=1 Tax=Apiospora rasikravindrae TaxID=990691 RepID=A0ABR1S444_9PEZI